MCLSSAQHWNLHLPPFLWFPLFYARLHRDLPCAYALSIMSKTKGIPHIDSWSSLCMQLPPLKFSALKIPAVLGAPNADFCFFCPGGNTETTSPLSGLTIVDGKRIEHQNS